MDQSRLDELKKPLQKRHQEPKRGSEQNSNGENFKVPNSEIQNSEASNFEVLNSKSLNYRAQNFEASNSETPNFDPDALNLEAELEAEADQNSACENNAEPQNFISDSSGALPQNSKARDYDKEPIVVKNYERLLISTITFLYAPMILGGYILSIWDLIFSKHHISMMEIGSSIIFGIFIAIALRLIYSCCVSNNNRKIYFMNNSIDFYNNGELERRTNNLHLNDVIGRPFWGYCNDDKVRRFIYNIIIIFSIAALSFLSSQILLLFIFSILSAIFLKIFFHFLIVGNFKNFSFFSAIVVDYPYYEQENTYYLSSILSAKNYLICIYDAKMLNEIKEWFLIRKHIDIDKIEKYYLS
ncbi:MAG: hypothetical protein ACLVCW_07980 [Campylobacter sp.]